MNSVRLVISVLAACTVPALAVSVIRVPQDAGTIQAAVDRAQAGDIVLVSPGLYPESVVIEKSYISLVADIPPDSMFRALPERVVLDGEGTRGTGIRVRGTAEQPVQGVLVRGFFARRYKDNGIVLNNAQYCRVELNEAGGNTEMFSAGIQLANSSFNSVAGNYLHDQQMWGVALFGGHFNTLRGNLVLRIHGLGAEDHFGQGFQITGNANLMLQNHLESNCTGILFYDQPASTGNYVWQNVIHSHHQPGILVPEPSNGNFILENDVTGNGMLHLAPSGRFDLWDEGPMNNTWRGNRAYAPF